MGTRPCPVDLQDADSPLMHSTNALKTVGTMTSEEVLSARMRGVSDYHSRLRSARRSQGLPDLFSDRPLIERIAEDYAMWEARREGEREDGRAA